MKADCAKHAIELHMEIEELATSAAAFFEKFILPMLSGPPTDHDLKSAIHQTLMNLGRVPESLMAELLKHTREKIQN